MPFRPHTLAYKLRVLFDAKVCTPQDIARSTGVSLRTIDGAMRGAKLDPVTRLQIDKVLSYYARLRNRHLKLEPEAEEPIREAPPVRGIKETRHEFPGVRAFHVISAKGEKRLEVIAPAGDVDEVLWEFMQEWLNRLDPPLSLTPSQELGESSNP